MFSGYWYWGLMIPLMVISPFLLRWFAPKNFICSFGISSFFNIFFNLLPLGWIGGILSAKLIVYIDNPSLFQYNYSKPEFWLGGQRWFGSFAFCVIYLLLFSDIERKPMGFKFLDMAALTICFLFVLGKTACFLAGHNADCSGSESDLPWAVIMPGKNYSTHPRQLYDAIFHFFL